jgi:hypothetical protein
VECEIREEIEGLGWIGKGNEHGGKRGVSGAERRVKACLET